MKPLRFGLIGLGYFGRNYARLLQGIKDVKLAAVAAKTQETLEQCRSATPKEAVRTTDASEIMKNPKIDCVVIATPANTHFRLAKEALDNGKHVLLEKPMAASLDEAKKLKALAAKSPSTFMAGHQFAYNDTIRHLRSLLAKKAIGKVKYAYGEHLLFQARDDIGCFWDAAPHQLSMLHCLLSPGSITKVTGISVPRQGSSLDGFTAATAEFESGLVATIIVSCYGTAKTRKMALAGEQGMAFFDDMQADKLKILANGKLQTPRIAAKEPLQNELEHFIHCIRTGQEPLTGMKSSYEIIEWMDKIERSVKGH